MRNQPIYVEDELYLGRLDEQEQFRNCLRVVLNAKDDESPFIFLIHGGGGMGKSKLARRLRDIAEKEVPFDECFHVLLVDWELVRHRTPALRVAREQIQPEEVLSALHRALLDKGWRRHFGKYQDILEQRQEAEQVVDRALEEHANENYYAAIRDLGASGLAKVIRLKLPAIGETGEQLSRALLAAGIQVGAEQAVRLREQAEQFLHTRLKPELYGVYRQPYEQLAYALGEGLRKISHQRPLIILFDTYEIVASADTWVRTIIQAGGARIIWVIAGRNNLAASRASDRYVGYSAEFPSGLFVWDMQELAIDHVEAYLLDRAPEREVTKEDSAAIHHATLGIPLALRQAADLWVQGVPLTVITEGVPDSAPHEKLVRLMSERVLIHVERGQAGEADRRALYLLAMQPRPDTKVQSNVLRPAEGRFDLAAYLAELASRYSVVKLEGGARLHDAMGTFVREYLLNTEASASDLVKSIAGQAMETLQTHRAKLEEDLPSLSVQCESEEWLQATLDLVYWLFWRDEQDAWHELIPRFVQGLGYGRGLAQSLLEVVGTFGSSLGQDSRKLLRNLNSAIDNRQTMLKELQRLAALGWLGESDVDETAELHGIIYLSKGEWLTWRGQNDKALNSLLTARRHLPDPATHLGKKLSESLAVLGRAYSDSREYEPAMRALRVAIELDEECGLAWHALGHVYSDRRQTEGAVTAFRRAVDSEPESVYHKHCLSAELCRQGNYSEALELCRAAIAMDPGNPGSWAAMGDVYGAVENYDEAIKAFEEAIGIDPDTGVFRNNLGVVYRSMGERDKAIELFQQALKRHMDDRNKAISWANIGTSYRELGQPEKAIRAFRKVTSLDPKFAGSWASLTSLHAELGQLEEAIRACTRATRLEPLNSRFHDTLGVLYRRKGDYRKAPRCHLKAIELSNRKEELAASWGNLGAAYYYLGRYDEAMAALEEAIRLDPQDGAPWHTLGHVYENTQRPEDAIVALEKAIELERNGDWLACLANLYRQTGQHSKAVEFYRQAIELMQKGLEVAEHKRGAVDHKSTILSVLGGMERLGRDQYLCGEYLSAAATFKRVLEFSPHRATSLNDLGFILIGAAEWEQAESLLKEALQQGYESPQIGLANLGYLYLRQHKYDQAMKVLQAAKQKASSDDEGVLHVACWHNSEFSDTLEERYPRQMTSVLLVVYANMATTYHLQGESELALTTAQTAIGIAPDDNRGYRVLGCLHLANGNVQTARSTWEEALQQKGTEAEKQLVRSWLAEL